MQKRRKPEGANQTSLGEMVLELNAEKAPITVENFLFMWIRIL